MQRQKVKSSNIVSVGYDNASQAMHVEFPSGVYEYKDVDPDSAWAFRNAKSLGSHFAANIRPKFKGVKIDDPLKPKPE